MFQGSPAGNGLIIAVFQSNSVETDQTVLIVKTQSEWGYMYVKAVLSYVTPG